MTEWKTWLIEPHDPLIARDGRPFNNTPGARATSLPFPVPTTIAGATRTLAGSDNDGHFVKTPDDVRKWEIRGPLLVELHDTSPTIRWMAPAPADALLLTHADGNLALRQQLVPLTLPPGALTDLTETHKNLCAIGPRDHDPAKSHTYPPSFWYWDEALAWLDAPVHQDDVVTISTLGHRGPLPEGRIHVGIDPATRVASEGMLFQTRGLEFTRSAPGATPTRLALALMTDAPLRETTAPIGGERRLARWSASDAALPSAEAAAAIGANIAASGGCRVLLLTPALFDGGFQPDAQSHLMQPPVDTNMQITLRGVAIGRAQVLSGWDMTVDNGPGKPRGAPKPTRRFVPAGTVLFLEIAGDAAAIQSWVTQHWMRCVSDGEQERRDGFGLAVFGVWSGEPETIMWGKQHAKANHTATTESRS